MSNYAIMRFQKYKLGSVAKLERHQQHRSHLTNRAHPEQVDKNRTWKRYNETMSRTVRKAIKEQEKNTGRKVRKDANVICEFVLTFSPEMSGQFNMPDWVRANFSWISKIFGKEKFLRADLNMDQKTPHLHCFVLMTDEQGKFNSSRFFNKKQQLVEMQDSYAADMAQFGLIRGESKEQTGARHQTLHEWKKSECERLEKELQEMKESVFADEKETTSPTIESEIFDDLR